MQAERTAAAGSVPPLGAEHAELVERTLAWAHAHALGPAEARPKQALNAATFAFLCGCEGRAEVTSLAARFALLFFQLDDAPEAELRELAELGRPDRMLQRIPGGDAWLRESEVFRNTCPDLAARFWSSFAIYLGAVIEELEVRRELISLEAHWNLRRRVAFIDPYIDLWLLCCELRPPADPSSSTCQALAVDLIVLANDLGSLERDLREGRDLNLVATTARVEGTSSERAAERLVALHNARAVEFRAAARRLCTLPGGRDYAALVSRIVDGNVAAMLALAHRFGRTNALLARLDSVAL